MSSELRQRGASRVIRLTRRGVATGVVGGVVIAIGYIFQRTELLFLGWFALLLPASAVLYVVLRRVRIDVTRSFSHPILVVGRPAVCQLELRNLSPYASATAQCRDVLPWQSSSADGERLAPIPGRATYRKEPRVLRYSLTPPRRGRFDIGPVTLELSDPFALARSEVVVGGTQPITVIPDVENLPHSGFTVTADDGSAHVQRLRALGGDDDSMTRNYRTGDALRRVHWRASAHRGELMVREEEQRSHAEARIVLDTTRHGYSDWHMVAGPRVAERRPTARYSGESEQVESELFEWALRIAAAVALHLEQRGFLVQFVETGHRQLAAPDRVDEFLESVAAIRLVSTADPATQSAHPRPDHSRGVIFAVIADAEPATIASLIDQRAHFGFAMAFIVSPGSDDAVRRLMLAGWRVVSTPPAASVMPLWESISPLLEGSHARR